MSKVRVNYWIDITIGAALMASAVSGLIFLLPGDLSEGLLGISYRAWSNLHTVSSLAMLAGVAAHLLLHWKWLKAMTRRVLSPAGRAGETGAAARHEPGRAAVPSPSRRAFLVFGGAATAGIGLLVAGYRALANAGQAEGSTQTAQVAGQGVACPLGLVNDPYPGRCRHYRDSNGDGICDYSVAGTGSNAVGTDMTGPNSQENWGRYRPGPGRP